MAGVLGRSGPPVGVGALTCDGGVGEVGVGALTCGRGVGEVGVPGWGRGTGLKQHRRNACATPPHSSPGR